MTRINIENFQQYIMNPEKEERLWDNAVFVFDSSSILDFYFLPANTRIKIYDRIFKELQGRLWMPSQVEFEYLKNREKIIEKPIVQHYGPLKEEIESLGKSFKSKIKNRIEEIERKTFKDDKHPHIEQTEINSIMSAAEVFQKNLSEFETRSLGLIKSAEEEILNLNTNDDVFMALEDNFVVGPSYSYTEVLEITKEGRHRFEYEIPPGYGDYKSKDKKGTQIFADLIIWKQILDYAKKEKKSIILIINDITKDQDWCYLDESNSEKRVLRPREELIKEIKDHAGVEFWMYSLSQFLYHSNNYLEAKLEEQEIDNVVQLISGIDRDAYGEEECCKCYTCEGSRSGYGNIVYFTSEIQIENEYDFDHENYQYSSVESGSCSWCSTLHVKCGKCDWINPIDSFNDNIECEGGCGLIYFADTSGISGPEEEGVLKIKDHRVQNCGRCGVEFVDSSSIGICDECEVKYNSN